MNNGQILNPKSQLKQYFIGKNLAILYLTEPKQVVINRGFLIKFYIIV
jgi:hypothetical protein